MRLGRQHKRPMQAFFNLAPPVAAVLAAAAACLLLREAWVALRFWYQVRHLHERHIRSTHASICCAISSAWSLHSCQADAHGIRSPLQ